MRTIVKESEFTGRGLVTRSGKRVGIYTDSALGEKPIHGYVEEKGYHRVMSWFIMGSNTSTGMHNDDIVLYSPDIHFNWDILPGWANACIFRKEGNWVCGSIVPEWKGVDYRTSKLGEFHILPKVVTDDILITQISDEKSLFINPKYKNDGAEV